MSNKPKTIKRSELKQISDYLEENNLEFTYSSIEFMVEFNKESLQFTEIVGDFLYHLDNIFKNANIDVRESYLSLRESLLQNMENLENNSCRKNYFAPSTSTLH